MRSTAAADWRSELPFEKGVVLAEIVPGEDARCVSCGPDAAAQPRSELWAFKHRHPRHHDGYVRIYCGAHVPRPAAPPRPATRPSTPAPRRRAAPEVRAAICPDCFVEVPPTGVCGVCGAAIVPATR